MTISADRVHLGQLITDVDEAYARMRRMIPALGAGPIDSGVLSEVQWEAIHRYDTLAEQVRTVRAARRRAIPAQGQCSPGA